jgi:hypothetical protein
VDLWRYVRPDPLLEKAGLEETSDVQTFNGRYYEDFAEIVDLSNHGPVGILSGSFAPKIKTL